VKLKYRVIERFRGKYPIGDMCKVFEVSRSGYYAWRKRQNVPPKDQWLVDLIIECQRESKQTYGFRRVRLWLERHQKYVNSKAILRIMRKYSLLSQVRRTKAYTHYKQAVHKYPNLLDRQFEQTLPNRFWVTDITYIPTPQGMHYMCAVVDLCGKVVLAWRLGSDMTASLVTDTIRDALQQEKVTDGLALHSDQGFQYTSHEYFKLTQSYNISPSMSRRGNPYDNAMAENFFSILKTECIHRIRLRTFEEANAVIDGYIQFYNFQRIQFKTKLTPVEFRCQFAA
jgi:transposase InsO family protein